MVTPPPPRPLLHALLALSAALLVLVALMVGLQRQGRDRLQVLPAVAIGTGLLITTRVQRHRRRRALLLALRQPPGADQS
jgi:hypothetical protein